LPTYSSAEVRRVAHLGEFLHEAETWVALAFIVFLGVLGYVGVHRMIGKSLDERSARIKAELDEARKLRDDAAQLLAEYQRKRAAAETEAQDIVASARADAEVAAAEKILAQEAKGNLAGELIAKGIDDVRKKLN